MLRRVGFLVCFVFCAVCLVPSQARPEERASAVVDNDAQRVQELRERLARPVSLEQGIGNNTSLQEALEFLGDRYAIPFVINNEAFKLVGNEAVADMPVHLAKIIGVKLSSVLRLILAQVHGTALLRPEFVEILPEESARPEVWKTKRELVPTVNAHFVERPLDQALRELAESSGINIILDPRAGEQTRTRVTATLSNVPIDTAVLVLADMAELRPVALDNVLYVTSKPNADELKMSPELLQRNVMPAGME